MAFAVLTTRTCPTIISRDWKINEMYFGCNSGQFHSSAEQSISRKGNDGDVLLSYSTCGDCRFQFTKGGDSKHTQSLACVDGTDTSQTFNINIAGVDRQFEIQCQA
eukprot:Awhi_evm1s4874